MASNSLKLWSILWAAAPLAAGQTFTALSSCINGNAPSDFPHCSSLYNTLNYCDGPSVSAGPPYVSCMCNQALFNQFYGCESDYRLCLGTDAGDLSIENGLEVWHSICDSELTTSITTPPISAVLTSFNQQFCKTAANACAAGELSQSNCLGSYTGSASAFSSCLCQPTMLSLAYTCQVLGNTSCQLIPGAITNLGQYNFCTNIVSVLGGPASTYANTTSSTLPLSTSRTNLSTTAMTGTTSPSTVSATTVVQTTFQGAPPAAPTASSTTTKSSHGTKLSLELSRLVGFASLSALILYI